MKYPINVHTDFTFDSGFILWDEFYFLVVSGIQASLEAICHLGGTSYHEY
jgi:hypothetical protein